MRKGANPAKQGLPAYQPKRLGIALLTYIPDQGGYFEHALEILKIQIASIYHSTPEPFDLWLFDNGSCPNALEELNRLQRDGLINTLIASKPNAGKTGALNVLLGGMPNEWICYSDSDVLFRKGWFENSCAIFEAFPGAGLVTVQPCFYDVLRGRGEAHLPILDDPQYMVEDVLLDEAVVNEYMDSINLLEEKRAKLRETPVKTAVERKTGIRAVIGATHMQFLMPKKLARSILPLPSEHGLSREEDYWLDKKVDEAGRMHLSTPQAFVYHMGNALDERTRQEILREGLADLDRLSPKREEEENIRWQLRLMNVLAKSSFFKLSFRRLYNLLFKFHAQ